MIAVQASELEKRYGPVRALSGVSAEIPAGTLTLVSGPNGAGKSTLLRILAGRTRPTRGLARVLETDPFGPRRAAHRGQVGYLGQDAGLYGELTVRENLEFCARLHALPSRNIDEQLGQLDLEEVAGQQVRTLSLGYRRRSGLARALLTDPRVLLLDEPWNGLDQESAGGLTALLRRYRDAGRTALVVAHSPSHAEGLFDAVLRLARGVRVSFEAGDPS